MPRPGLRHLCLWLWLAVVMMAGASWPGSASAEPRAFVSAPVVAIDVDTQTHEEAPRAPLLPPDATDGESSDGEPAEGEYDADSPERMIPLLEPSWIPPPQCAGLLGMGLDSLPHQTGPSGLFRPPRV